MGSLLERAIVVGQCARPTNDFPHAVDHSTLNRQDGCIRSDLLNVEGHVLPAAGQKGYGLNAGVEKPIPECRGQPLVGAMLQSAAHRSG